MKRTVFFLSDRTGITAETLGHALLTQFEGVEFQQTSWPYLDSEEKARQIVERINQAAVDDGCKPLAFSTLINPQLRDIVRQSDALLFDFFETFTAPMEKELGMEASRVSGRSHGMGSISTYTSRIDALNFALSHDDGVTTSSYSDADIILVGVSRSGKTPTSLYLALQYGVLAANYPVTEEDFENTRLPEVLRPYRDKLFGLSIHPERLHQIRSERRPDSRYATIRQCRFEVKAAEAMFRRERIRFLNTSYMSIEEIATSMMQVAGLQRRLYG